jgi:hypothetical protein
MHPVGHAASLHNNQHHNLHVRLGDFKATFEGRGSATSFPDMACMTTGGNPKQRVRFVGECKADWALEIQRDYNGAQDSRAGMKKWISKCIQNAHFIWLCLLILSRADIKLLEGV